MNAKEHIARILDQFSDPTQCALQLADSFPTAGTPRERQDWIDEMSACLAFTKATERHVQRLNTCGPLVSA